MNSLLLAALLAAPIVRAQTAPLAPPPGFGLAVAGSGWTYAVPGAAGGARVLNADEETRLATFFTTHPAGTGDDALAAPLYAFSVLEGLDPAKAGWFTGEGDALRLTDLGRDTIPEAVLVAYAEPSSGAASAAAVSAAARIRTAALSVPASADAVNFDGDAVRAAAASVVPAPEGYSSSAAAGLLPSSVANADLPDAPVPNVVPALAKTAKRPGFDEKLFWGTWWGYHAAWAADFTTTAMVLSRGGYEKDPLYTRFGNKNMLGVIGSAAAVHVGLSLGAIVLHNEAKKHKGFERYALEAAAVGLNSYFIEVHAQAATGNAQLLNNWPR